MAADRGVDRDSGPRFVCYITDTGETRMLVPILVCGDLYSYTIPSFSVVTVEMRRIKYELLLEDGQPKIVDGFIRDDPSLQRLYPAQLSIEMNPLKATIVEVEELRDNLNLDGFKFEPSNKALVIWKWKWTDQDETFEDNASDDEEITVIPETPPAISDEEEEEEEEEQEEECDGFHLGFSPVVTHTVTFKCIGTTKEDRYQETLARVAQVRNAGQEVLCKLQPEPENPFDSLAIAFKCEVDSSWHTIGYVVKEALDDVHEAMSARKITAVSFDWVKFIIYWRTPGWYAGIKISRIGEWSRTVVLSQSAKQ